jgi:hypothetical protein
MTSTYHTQVAACCDRCANCDSPARLIAVPGRYIIECSNANCFAMAEHPDLHEAMRKWNLKQRAARENMKHDA